VLANALISRSNKREARVRFVNAGARRGPLGLLLVVDNPDAHVISYQVAR
jgi:hypothetical protein